MKLKKLVEVAGRTWRPKRGKKTQTKKKKKTGKKKKSQTKKQATRRLGRLENTSGRREEDCWGERGGQDKRWRKKRRERMIIGGR